MLGANNQTVTWINLPTVSSKNIEYKYIIKKDANVVNWEGGDNRRVDLSSYKTGDQVKIEDDSFGATNTPAHLSCVNRGITPPNILAPPVLLSEGPSHPI